MYTFLVYGHNEKGKGVIIEISAASSSQAIDIARRENPNYRFNHANLA